MLQQGNMLQQGAQRPQSIEIGNNNELLLVQSKAGEYRDLSARIGEGSSSRGKVMLPHSPNPNSVKYISQHGIAPN